MNLLRKLIFHELISGSFYIFLGSMISNVLAFILNLYLARNLSYADYAIFASLLSVFTLAAIPAGSVNTIIVKFATDHFVKKQNDQLKALYLIFLKFMLGFAVSIAVLFFLFAIPLKNFLHIENIWYILIVGLATASVYLFTLNSAFLQSLLKFRFIAFLNAFGGVIKLIVGASLVYVGFRAFGGLLAVLFMTLGMFIFAYIPLIKILKTKQSTKKVPLDVGKMIAYAVPTFITVLCLASFTSIDVILVKHFFSPHLAGFYAGLSLIGKVIFYFTIPIPMVMFPLLVKRHTTGKNFNNLFYLSLLLVLLPSFMITVFYFIFPSFVIKLFLGGRDYLYISNFLGIFGLYLTVFSMVNVCVSFFLSLNKTKIAIPVIIAAISQIILIFLFHADFYQIIEVSLLTLSILFIFLIALFIKNFGNIHKINKSAAFINGSGL